jgi:hypothetical protein
VTSSGAAGLDEFENTTEHTGKYIDDDGIPTGIPLAFLNFMHFTSEG